MYQRPNIVVGDSAGLTSTATKLLGADAFSTILSCNHSIDDLLTIFKSTDCIITDADGTVVKEGFTEFPKEYANNIQQLSDKGITSILITGKPYAEVSELVASLPTNSPIRIIYEKGAYYLKPDSTGIMRKTYLLSTPELESNVLELRKLFIEHKTAIESKYRDDTGRQLLTLGWAGSGTHQSLLSIDIFAGTLPENYLQIQGTARGDLRLKDPILLAQIEADLQTFVDKFKPGWKLINVGNGNSEITPVGIEKDLAIKQLDEFKNAHGVLVWGDSGNDRKMFDLRRLPKVHSGLVLHRKTSINLVSDVDFVSFGMANARPFFELLLN